MQLLEKRQTEYGDYRMQCSVKQPLLATAINAPNWPRLTNSQQESINMIFTKISRVLTGNPDHVDNWDDIAGYATLISKQIKGEIIKAG